jgi:hypothetical protein
METVFKLTHIIKDGDSFNEKLLSNSFEPFSICSTDAFHQAHGISIDQSTPSANNLKSGLVIRNIFKGEVIGIPFDLDNK